MTGLMALLFIMLAAAFFAAAKLSASAEEVCQHEDLPAPLMRLSTGCFTLFWFFLICFLITAVWYAAQQGVQA